MPTDSSSADDALSKAPSVFTYVRSPVTPTMASKLLCAALSKVSIAGTTCSALIASKGTAVVDKISGLVSEV